MAKKRIVRRSGKKEQTSFFYSFTIVLIVIFFLGYGNKLDSRSLEAIILALIAILLSKKE